MKLSNLHTIIAAIIVIYAMTLATVWALPGLADTIEKLANLVIGGLLAIMRPPSQQVAA
jgi:hypothetical protein